MPKDKRDLFLILSIAGLAVVAFLLFTVNNARDAEKKLRLAKETTLTAKEAELAKKEADLKKLLKQKSDFEKESQEKITGMEASLAALEEKSKSLSSKIDALTKENSALVSDKAYREQTLTELGKKISRLEIDKIDLMEAVRRLKESTGLKISEAFGPGPGRKGQAGASSAVKLGKIIVQKSTGSVARVEEVNSVYGFIVVNAGENEGLKKNSVINIIRGNELIGKAVVQKTKDDLCAAVLVPEFLRAPIEPGDAVSLS